MTELSEPALLAAVEEALDARLVLEVPAAASTTYSFTHALVREALLEEMSRARRERLHLRAAEAIDSLLAGEGRAAVLAAHYQQAGSLAPADKAIDALIQAGQDAGAVLAWEEVAAYWQTALALMERTRADIPRRADLFARLADLLYVTGFDLEGSIQYAEKAIGLFAELSDRQRVAVMRSRLGGYLTSNPVYGVMDISRGLREFQEAEQVLQNNPESLPYGYLQGTLAGALGIWAVRPEEALVTSQRAMDIAGYHGHDAL